MSIEFRDFMDLEGLVSELDNVEKLLSILGENVFNRDEKLTPYARQFRAVNFAALASVKFISLQIKETFNNLHKKLKCCDADSIVSDSDKELEKGCNAI